MHIIHLVLGKANPERMNGVNKVVHNLASEQKNMGYKVSVWGITPSHKEKTTERAYDLCLFPSKKIKISLSPELKEALAALTTDCVVQIHGGFIPEFYSVFKILLKKKIPYIITPHGNYASNALRKKALFKKLYFNIFEKKILMHSKAIQCISKGEWDDLDKLISLPNKVLIPNGQNLFPKMAKSSTFEIPIFGYCGRVTREQKGLDLLQEGFKIYKFNYKQDGKLWVIGEGEYLTQMKEFARNNNLESDIIFWGSRFGEEKLQIITDMDAFYHPSRNEGLPIALLEAASLAVPCVVSEFTNISDNILAFDAGIKLENNTPVEVANSMKTIASWKTDGKLYTKGENARKMISSQYDWHEIALKLLEVYKS